MKKVLIIAAALLATTNLYAAAEKATVCHESQEGVFFDISVSTRAIPAFERQGDFIGSCALKALIEECGDLGVNEAEDACNPAQNLNDLESEYQEYQDATVEEEGEYDEEEGY